MQQELEDLAGTDVDASAVHRVAQSRAVVVAFKPPWGRQLKHNNNFDLLRLLAACQVVAMHASEWLKLPFSHSVSSFLPLFPGVPIFFVISGFLIPASFNSSRSVTHYFSKRALRIFPGMWANLALILTMMIFAAVIVNYKHLIAWIGIVAGTGSTTLASTFIYAPFAWNSTLPFFPGGVLWTITIELGFYLLAPLLFATRGWLLWVVVITAGVASYACEWWQQTWLQSGFVKFVLVAPYLWIFLLGSVAFLTWDRIRRVFEGRAVVWFVVYVSYSYFVDQIPDYQNLTVANTVQIVLLACVVLSAAHTAPSMAKALRGNDISYGVYLYHMPVVLTLMALHSGSTVTLWLAVYTLTIAVAACSWLFVERPALALKSRDSAAILSRQAAS